MLKDLTRINITGALFSTPTLLEFFNPHDGDKIKTIKGALLYGRNGTGKSTIAKAVYKLSGGIVPGISCLSCYDDLGNLVSLSEAEKKHIFVFNEDYVDKNVKIQQDHLETIVMLGPAADLSEKIEKAEKAQDAAKTAYEQQDKIYREYCDARNVKSPGHYINLIGNALRGDDNWAGRDKEINGGRQNTAVRDDTYKKFLSIVPSKGKSELLTDYKDKMKALEAAKTGAAAITQIVPAIPNVYCVYDGETVRKLLAQEIEKPELSEREKKLFSLIRGGMVNDLTDRMELFRKSETTECPYCFQYVTTEYKASLVESLEKVLSKAVEEHQKALRTHIIALVNIDLTPYAQLAGYQLCMEMLDRINAAIEGCNEKLRKKIDSPYNPIILDSAETAAIGALADQIAEALKELEKTRLSHNEKARATGPIIKELNRINSEIAYYDVSSFAAQLETQQRECAVAEALLSTFKKAYDDRKKEVGALEAQRKNVRLAVDSINACMKYVFFADDRLKIEYVDGEYRLLSHGKSVKPCDVSVGERNIIGLCYFFNSILEGKEEKNAYKEEYLLVIDDPVSSFDTENRIGILSFLKYKLGAFLEGNQDTKALVMTHDLKTFYDIHKILEEIVAACKKQGYRHEPKFNRFELREGTLKQFSYSNRQEYTEIIDIVYKYASGQAKEYDFVIGNMMRQVLEAYSTFEYKKGIETISTDSQILNLLPAPEYISYYKNLMYRLVLHGGSYKEEQIKTMSDFRFFTLLTEEEKMRTAKDILCFIFLLNRMHLLEHLKSNKNAEVVLNGWCEDIKKRSAII